MKSTKSQRAALRQISRDAWRIADQLTKLELMPIAEIARKWRVTKEYVRRNVPIVKLGPKKHRVRLEDAMEFQSRRTQQP